ncbi:putative lipoprotein [Methylocaldum marinum]|uniref:Putative lipoprotein n=1 Tax=Methylocaldum marinum TaxID=1432792 RepID=A0A286P473_9GAMM|nr:putative lipoprotein [Methylocaldum marinum]
MRQETSMNMRKQWAIIISIGLILAGCGKEGPLGNTPGPKKPQQQTTPFDKLSG